MYFVYCCANSFIPFRSFLAKRLVPHTNTKAQSHSEEQICSEPLNLVPYRKTEIQRCFGKHPKSVGFWNLYIKIWMCIPTSLVFINNCLIILQSYVTQSELWHFISGGSLSMTDGKHRHIHISPANAFVEDSRFHHHNSLAHTANDRRTTLGSQIQPQPQAASQAGIRCLLCVLRQTR